MFSGAVNDYEVSTTNTTNAVTATASKSGAVVTITVNGEPHVSGESATWDEGANEVIVVVKYGTTTRTYTVAVTKTT